MKIAYITAHTPFGRGETFVLEEMLAIAELGVELVIIPRNPPKEVFHCSAQKLLDQTIYLPLFNLQIFLSFLKTALLNLRFWKIIGKILRDSRTSKILVKNLAVVPKAVFIAGLLRQTGVEHIHAHWGSTTATMAWIASELTGIPWSVTLHRWDIAENNLLKLKTERAAFVRCIAEDGKREVLSIVGEAYKDKVIVVHMGVLPPDGSLLQSRQSRPEFVIACPANFVPVKGHRFLIKACAQLVEKGIQNFRCLLIGDGPLEATIRQQITELGMEEFILLLGRLPHEELLGMYARGEVDLVVLPSIVTSEGEKEGIPVALMEAMAYGIPVISTLTGGIPELLKEGAGLLVPPASATDLAKAITLVIKNEDFRKSLSRKGRERILAEFDLRKNAAALLEMMRRYRVSRPACSS